MTEPSPFNVVGLAAIAPDVGLWCFGKGWVSDLWKINRLLPEAARLAER